MLNRKIVPSIEDAVNFKIELPLCKKANFRNGLPVYWYSGGTQEVLQVQWVFQAGLWQEDRAGLAHAAAGLLKNGTIGKSAQALNEMLEFFGASLKSSAGNDYSTVSLNCLTKHLHQILPIIREIILEASYPESEVDIYKKNALNSLMIKSKKVDFIGDRESDAQLFGYHHPYGRFSNKEDIDALNAADIRAYHHHYYRSSNCQMFVSGRFEDAHLADLEHFFGQEPWGIGPEIALKTNITPEPAAQMVSRYEIGGDNVQGAVRILSPFPNIGHPDFAPMGVLNTILGGYFGSRLMMNIREDKGYTYGIYSQIYPYKNAASLTVATEAAKEVCDQVIEEVYKEMKLLREEQVGAEELKLVKNYLFGNLQSALDGPFQIMRQWKGLVLNNFDENHFYESLEVFRKVTPEELQNLANKYLLPERFYQILVV